ncbi:hypothetical protein BDQ17DRAFT_1352493 [Cyathus striatus]|nr:hypothetical protein BDQ17DRAFT_1352493 [Cyathus striatus]
MATAPHSHLPLYPYQHSHSPLLLASFPDWPNSNLLFFPTDTVPLTTSDTPLQVNSTNHMAQQNGRRSGVPTSQLTSYEIGAMSAQGTFSDDLQWTSNPIANPTSTITQHTYNDNSHSYGWTCEATAYNTPVDSPPGPYIGHHSSPSTSSHTQSPYPNVRPTMPLPLESPATSADMGLSPQYTSSRMSSPGTPARSPDTNTLQLITSGVATDRPQFSHRQQLQMFRDVVANNPTGNFGPFIPQQMYKPHTNSDWKRYVEEVDTDAPIFFWTVQPDECGILLSDALHSRVKRLSGRDQTVFEGRGPSVSIRLEWPGYRPWSRQIPTKDFKSPPGPITLAKLAKNVAKCVQRFIEERRHQSMDEEADPRWRIGQGHITIDDIVLVSIHHVSLGSWQPQLRLRYPFPNQWS